MEPKKATTNKAIVSTSIFLLYMAVYVTNLVADDIISMDYSAISARSTQVLCEKITVKTREVGLCQSDTNFSRGGGGGGEGDSTPLQFSVIFSRPLLSFAAESSAS